MSLEATSISDIKSNILRPATTSQFYASVPFPQESLIANRLQKLLGPDQRKLTLACSEVSLPGSSFATTKIDNDRTGVTETHAYRRLYDNITLTFYVDAEKYLPIKFFEMWMTHIAGEDLQATNIFSNNFSYRFRYPDDYVSDQGLTVIKFEKDFLTQVKKPNLLEDIVNIIAGTNFGDTVNKQTGTSLRYTFKRAFPIAMNSMPLSYNASQLLKVTVTFAYSRYVVDGILNNITTEGDILAFMEDHGRSREDATTILEGGFVETLIG